MSRFVASRYRQAAEKKVASANATLLSDKTLNESKFEPGSASSPLKAPRADSGKTKRPVSKRSLASSKSDNALSSKAGKTPGTNMRPSSSTGSLASKARAKDATTTLPEKAPFAAGITSWPNGALMTKIEISAVHMVNSLQPMMEAIRDPERLKNIDPLQLQRIVSYQRWFNQLFRDKGPKQRKALNKRQRTKFEKLIAELQEVNAIYQEKKARVEEAESAEKTREELTHLEALVTQLDPLKEAVEEARKSLKADEAQVSSQTGQNLLDVSAEIETARDRIVHKLESCGGDVNEIIRLINLKSEEAELKIKVEEMKKKLAIQKEKEAAVRRQQALEEFAEWAEATKDKKGISLWD
ncbi:Oidioi.mRNA.OKI2018_I69.XSR.g14796.t1.cds [Oikopleura dioica]|uniref:Oidioi.mRNA.OKI2018_I69.XSR.g14796.t1.cds n=1 Tax=Oikopleura dioica TaxID=34765 RepID=A0ABN7SEW7_OIKDI|nr:Oidioi.mRNA.OKI2018_I69.XSR.g14796.t1.cds [Oikopleura dioica]